jgi:hypothetical protein
MKISFKTPSASRHQNEIIILKQEKSKPNVLPIRERERTPENVVFKYIRRWVYSVRPPRRCSTRGDHLKIGL